MPSFILHGQATGILAAVPGHLMAAGFVAAGAAPAAMLVNWGGGADAGMAAAHDFAAALAVGEDALIVNLLAAAAPGDWPAASAAATLWAFTRHMALAWAPRRIRVNALGLGSSPVLPGQPAEEAGRAAGAAPAQAATAADVAATIVAFWAATLHDRATDKTGCMNAPRIADAQRALRHVFLRDMVLSASVGVHAFEHTAAQRIRINVDLAVEDDSGALSRAAPGRDELSRVVDYEAVAENIRAIVAAGHVRLLETLAERMAEACLLDARVHLARIRVEKLDIFADTASVGVEIERRSNTSSGFIPHSPVG